MILIPVIQKQRQEQVIRKIQQERGLDAGDRALRGDVGMEVNAPERLSNYV
jgi:hypothetical protein